MRPYIYVAAAQPVEVPVALTTVPNVELLEVGEDWHTSTGDFTWDTEDLASAVAATDDPAIRTPIIKLGHTDPRFDGQPSVGRIENLRTSNNDQTLVGDLVGVPVWLAKVMPSAYPRRSIEGFFRYQSRTGNTWPFMLTGVALLGAMYPAIDTLEDISVMWGEDPPELTAAADVPEVVASVVTPRGTRIIAERREPVPTWRKPVVASQDGGGGGGQPVAAATSVEDIRRAYYETLDSAQYWWWIREVRVSPTELIVDDDEGSLYRVGYTIGTDDSITFDDPQQVKIEYVDVTAAAGFHVAAKFGDPVASGRPDRGNGEGMPRRPAVSATMPPTKEETGMKLSDDAIRRLGLDPAKATEDEVSAAILEAVTDGDGSGGTGDEPKPDETPPTTPTTEPTTPTETPTTTPATTPTETTPTTTEQAATTPTTSIPDGMTLIDQATLDELKSGVAAARKLVADGKIAARNRVLDDAIRAGKFPKARRENYEKMLIADPDGGAAIIASLAEGMIPVEERGVQGGEADPGTQGDAYPESWKPAVAAAQRSIGARVKVVND